MKNMTKKNILFLGVLAGVVAIILAKGGNPKNMAICAACFIRDMAGAMRLHNAAVVQYFRPEIVGIAVGAFIISLLNKEYKSSASTPVALVTRFIGGITMMIGALVFLGCTTRMTLRMAAGDISAYVGLIGLFLGVGTGFFFLKNGYALPKKVEINKSIGAIFPAVMSILLVISVATPYFAASQKGPGSMHAPFIVSLLGGITFGIVAQKTRMCFTGSFRNMIFMKNFEMIIPIAGMFFTVLIYNIVTKQFAFTPYGAIAHNQNLWNILGLYVVGLAGTLIGGCPLRQIVLAGQGSIDSVVAVIGMFVGAAMAHNLKLAAAPSAKATEKAAAVLGGPGKNGQIAIFICIVVLLAIGFMNLKKKK